MYSIKDLENLTGIQTHTIRMWEQRYNLLNPERTSTNNRVYSDDDLRKIMFAALLNNNGMKISKIAGLSDADINEAVLRLSGSSDSVVESHIETLKLIMIEMNEEKFEKLFAHLVLHIGFEETIIRIFAPLFRRLLFLMQTGVITVLQGNFMTSLYKQKMYVAIDGLAPPKNPDHKMFVMFLPEMEYLDTGLLFCSYMARKRGCGTLYIDVPCRLKDIQNIIEKNSASYILSIATMTKTDLTEYYTNVLNACNPNQKLLLLGNQIGTVKINDSRLTIFQNYTEFQGFLNKIY